MLRKTTSCFWSGKGSHRGWRVRLPDPSTRRATLRCCWSFGGRRYAMCTPLRMIFEPPACRMAAERATDDGVARLRQTLAEELDADDDRLIYPIVAWRLHSELAELSSQREPLAVLMRHAAASSQSRAAPRVVATRWDKTVWRAGLPGCTKSWSTSSREHKGKEAEAFWRRHMRARQGAAAPGDRRPPDLRK